MSRTGECSAYYSGGDELSLILGAIALVLLLECQDEQARR